jgi:hypothetical protein
LESGKEFAVFGGGADGEDEEGAAVWFDGDLEAESGEIFGAQGGQIRRGADGAGGDGALELSDELPGFGTGASGGGGGWGTLGQGAGGGRQGKITGLEESDLLGGGAADVGIFEADLEVAEAGFEDREKGMTGDGFVDGIR